jgi:plastocyanin
MKQIHRAAAIFAALVLLSMLSMTAVFGAASPATVEVRLTEYAFDMPQTLPPGPTTFVLRNEGHKSHSFKLEGPGIEDMTPVIVKPNKTGTVQVTLKPGDYKVYCPIGSHSAKGMTMTLAVKAK